MGIKTILALLLCNFFWSMNPLMSKITMENFTPAQAGFLRYASALVMYSFMCLLRTRGRLIIPKNKSDWIFLTILSVFPFCFYPILQMEGLHLSRATDNALIIGIEPLITVVLAWLVLREHVSLRQIFALSSALAGIMLLSTDNDLSFSMTGHLLGNIIMIISLIGEGFFSVASKKLMERHSVTSIFGTGLLIGVVLMAIYLLFTDGLPPISNLNLRNLGAIFWIGPMSTTFAYLFWMSALKKGVPIPAMVITLFLQPVLGSIWGIFLLNEHLTWLQSLGTALIFFAILSQFRYRK